MRSAAKRAPQLAFLPSALAEALDFAALPGDGVGTPSAAHGAVEQCRALRVLAVASPGLAHGASEQRRALRALALA